MTHYVPEGQATCVIGSAQSRWLVAVANHNMDDHPSTFYVAPLAKVAGAATLYSYDAAADKTADSGLVTGWGRAGRNGRTSWRICGASRWGKWG